MTDISVSAWVPVNGSTLSITEEEIEQTLLSDYLMYEERSKRCIFINQIAAKYINLSFSGCKFLTTQINDVEENN